MRVLLVYHRQCGNNTPQGLKPGGVVAFCGTTEVVPFQISANLAMTFPTLAAQGWGTHFSWLDLNPIGF